MNDKDLLKDYLKQELDDFESTIPVDGWDKLASSLNGITKRRRLQRWTSVNRQLQKDLQL